MNTSDYGFICSIGTQEIYVGKNDAIHGKIDVLDQDSEAFYDYTFNTTKQHAEMLKEAYSNSYPHYKVFDLENPELINS